MNRKKLAMNWDGLGDEDDDDHFFESRERISSVAPVDLASSDSDDDDFEDSRMSFVSTMSSASSVKPNTKYSSIMSGYDMWMAEPGDIRERRKRLLQGMGLSSAASTKDMLRLASRKLAGAVSKKHDTKQVPTLVGEVDSSPTLKVDSAREGVKVVDSAPKKESRSHEHKREQEQPSRSHLHPTAIVLVRSRSDGDIDAFSARTKQRKEELIGPVSKQRLTRTVSELVVPTIGLSAVRKLPKRAKNRTSKQSNDVSQPEDAISSFFLIKNLDTGKEFIVKEYNDQGQWNKLSDVQTGKQLTMEEFEKSVGYSPAVKELMRRKKVANAHDDKKLHHISYFSKSFRNSKRKGAAILKNIKGVASSKSLSLKEHDHSSPEENRANKASSQWVKARQHGKAYQEFTALHKSQEYQAHDGPIWTIRFSLDAHFLASAGEDKVVHVWEVQECEIMSTKSTDDLSSVSSTPVHPMAGGTSDRPSLAEITLMPSDRQVVDWTDVHEMVTAASYTPDGQFAPWNPSEVLITSTDSRIRIHNGPELISKYRGFRNTSSQIPASFSPDGRHIISASEDSQVYIWQVAESKNTDGGRRSKVTVHSHEHFHCKDVIVAIPWPGSIKNEPPIVELQSKRHSKRFTAPQPNSSNFSPTHEDNTVGATSKRHLPPLPKKLSALERLASCDDEDLAQSPGGDPGIGVSNSFRSSASMNYRDSPSISATSRSHSWSSRSFSDNGGQTVQATAWGMVIVAASIEGEIRVYQNFGLPRKVSRQANLFRD